MGDLIKWIFFDIGSTLFDESDSEEYRINEVLADTDINKEDFIKEYISLASQSQDAFHLLVKKYNLKYSGWPAFKDRLIPGIEEILDYLKDKYHLGIIANQPLGTEKRLESFGIRKYFEVVISSAEVGYVKPQPEIFQLALKQAKTKPEESLMIGDRLENDIRPAQELGFKTIWFKNSYGKYGNPELLPKMPDHIIDSIFELKQLL